ncbi:MAG: methyltransferase domain-containing protein [Parcubacteria group bacterium]|nr:methyltransferase domain-containing protein [Parcubacteria group bacterium]
MLGVLSGRPNEDWTIATDDLPTLPVLGERLKSVDQLFLEVFAQRLRLAQLIEERKRRDAQVVKDSKEQEESGRIYHKKRETDRIAQAREWAAGLGVNPDFAHALQYFAIGEACKVQMIQRQDRTLQAPEFASEDQAYAWRKKELLALTACCASSYDAQYGSSFSATKAYLAFEARVLGDVAAGLDATELALDLGCATGRQALALANRFSRVQGYDISPDMVRVAREKHAASNGTNVRFEVADLEGGIPLGDGCADFVVMGMGVASDIRDIKGVLREVRRVLKSGGKALLSFYNRNAIVYDWNFIPWPLPLAAFVNLDKHCLDVRWSENGREARTFSIYARPYSPDDVEALLPGGMVITRQTTYPTLASVLPDVLFVDPAVCESVLALDEHLADADRGAYALVTVRKT